MLNMPINFCGFLALRPPFSVVFTSCPHWRTSSNPWSSYHCCCLVGKSWATLCEPLDFSPQGSVSWISQEIVLEWVAVSFSRGSSWPRDQTYVSCLAGGFFPNEPPRKPNQWSRNWENDWTSRLQWIETVGWVHTNEELQIHQHVPVEIWGHNQGLGFRCHCRLANWWSCAHLQPFLI